MPRSYTQVILMGKNERIHKEFRNASGNLTSATNVKVSVYDPDGTVVVDDQSATEESTGIFYYTWSVSTAAANKEGLYTSWWSGSIGAVSVTQDKPTFYLVRRYPYITQQAGELIDSVRRLIGDDQPSNYRISDIDMLQYIGDGVRLIQTDFDMGYSVTITYSSITFNKTLTSRAKHLFIHGSALSILRHLRHKGLWGVGSLDVGDLRVNMTNVNRERALAAKDLEAQINKTIGTLQRGNITGASVDTYYTGESTIVDLVGV